MDPKGCIRVLVFRPQDSMYFETRGRRASLCESKLTLSVAHTDLLLVFRQGQMTQKIPQS
jgi:hypothetical protein